MVFPTLPMAFFVYKNTLNFLSIDIISFGINCANFTELLFNALLML